MSRSMRDVLSIIGTTIAAGERTRRQGHEMTRTAILVAMTMLGGCGGARSNAPARTATESHLAEEAPPDEEQQAIDEDVERKY